MIKWIVESNFVGGKDNWEYEQTFSTRADARAFSKRGFIGVDYRVVKVFPRGREGYEARPPRKLC